MFFTHESNTAFAYFYTRWGRNPLRFELCIYRTGEICILTCPPAPPPPFTNLIRYFSKVASLFSTCITSPPSLIHLPATVSRRAVAQRILFLLFPHPYKRDSRRFSGIGTKKPLVLDTRGLLSFSEQADEPVPYRTWIIPLPRYRSGGVGAACAWISSDTWPGGVPSSRSSAAWPLTSGVANEVPTQ